MSSETSGGMSGRNATTQVGRRGLLWVSAVVLGVLVLVQLGRVSGGRGNLFESTAMADLVSQSGSFTTLTCDTGNDEVLWVLDGRRELLMVYRVENQNTVALLQRVSLPQMFNDAQAKAQGKIGP